MIHCQSCGIPIIYPHYLGTNADGTKNEDYCKKCYHKGEFREPKISLEEMKHKVGNFLLHELCYSKEETQKIIDDLPTYKRWKS